jgi:hypothetical protein
MVIKWDVEPIYNVNYWDIRANMMYGFDSVIHWPMSCRTYEEIMVNYWIWGCRIFRRTHMMGWDSGQGDMLMMVVDMLGWSVSWWAHVQWCVSKIGLNNKLFWWWFDMGLEFPKGEKKLFMNCFRLLHFLMPLDRGPTLCIVKHVLARKEGF